MQEAEKRGRKQTHFVWCGLVAMFKNKPVLTTNLSWKIHEYTSIGTQGHGTRMATRTATKHKPTKPIKNTKHEFYMLVSPHSAIGAPKQFFTKSLHPTCEGLAFTCSHQATIRGILAMADTLFFSAYCCVHHCDRGRRKSHLLGFLFFVDTLRNWRDFYYNLPTFTFHRFSPFVHLALMHSQISLVY